MAGIYGNKSPQDRQVVPSLQQMSSHRFTCFQKPFARFLWLLQALDFSIQENQARLPWRHTVFLKEAPGPKAQEPPTPQHFPNLSGLRNQKPERFLSFHLLWVMKHIVWFLFNYEKRKEKETKQPGGDRDSCFLVTVLSPGTGPGPVGGWAHSRRACRGHSLLSYHISPTENKPIGLFFTTKMLNTCGSVRPGMPSMALRVTEDVRLEGVSPAWPPSPGSLDSPGQSESGAGLGRNRVSLNFGSKRADAPETRACMSSVPLHAPREAGPRVSIPESCPRTPTRPPWRGSESTGG